MPSLRMAPGERCSGEQSQIFWAYYRKAVRTNEIMRSVLRSTSLTTVKFVHPSTMGTWVVDESISVEGVFLVDEVSAVL